MPVGKLDKTPFRQSDFYKTTINEIEQLGETQREEQPLLCGWAKVNLQPPYPTPIAIDAKRKGKKFTGVRDSIYARAVVFKQGNKKIAYISADLLIIPPTVTEILDTLLKAENFNLKNIYLTATHTHTSIGAWHNSYVGKIFAGKFDENIPRHIAQCIARAIRNAEQNMQESTLGSASVGVPNLVYNRLVGEKGKLDSTLHVVRISRVDGKQALLFSFSAHATIFHEKMMELSADWPGLAMKILEQNEHIDFASFSAGAVGSHGPFQHSQNKEEELKYMGESVATHVLMIFDSISTRKTNVLNMQRIQIHLRQPQMRLTMRYALKPKLFNKLFGNNAVFVSKLQIGNTVFVGMPCDFSGELSYSVQPVASAMGLDLHITSFNGGFCGYITDDRWYCLNAYETKTMNWFGRGNGNYFSEVATRMLHK